MQFEQWEIKRAQASLDMQPSFSPYWDSRSGQEDLQVIDSLGLQASTTEQERRLAHRDAMRTPLDVEHLSDGERLAMDLRDDPHSFGVY